MTSILPALEHINKKLPLDSSLLEMI